MGEKNNALDALIDALKENSVINQNEEASDQAGGNTTTGDNNASNTTNKSERVFTQDEVSRMMAREKHQGRNAVYSELGIDPDDTSAVKMFKAFVEAQKTEEQKKSEQDAKRQQQINDMNQKLKVAETKAALMQAGVIADYVDDAVTIALARIANNDSLDVETVAKDLKAKYSVWFDSKNTEHTEQTGQTGQNEQNAGSNTQANENSTGKRGTGRAPASGTGSTGSNSNKVSGLGKRLAESRKSQLPKKSYWD